MKDPEPHLTTFHTQMMLTGGFDAVYCKLLMSTLKPTDEAMTVHAFVKGMLPGPFNE